MEQDVAYVKVTCISEGAKLYTSINVRYPECYLSGTRLFTLVFSQRGMNEARYASSRRCSRLCTVLRPIFQV